MMEANRRALSGVARCVAILASTQAADGGYGEILVEELRTASMKAGIRVVPVLVDGPNEFERALEIMAKAGAQAVITQELFTPHRVVLIDLATKQHLAVMGTRETTAVRCSPLYPPLY